MMQKYVSVLQRYFIQYLGGFDVNLFKEVVQVSIIFSEGTLVYAFSPFLRSHACSYFAALEQHFNKYFISAVFDRTFPNQ